MMAVTPAPQLSPLEYEGCGEHVAESGGMDKGRISPSSGRVGGRPHVSDRRRSRHLAMIADRQSPYGASGSGGDLGGG
jgi:hypothetical protein